MSKKRSLRSQRFHRWFPPLFVPTKTIKSPNFTLRKREIGVRISPPFSLFHHIQDNIKKKKRKKNGKQKQK